MKKVLSKIFALTALCLLLGIGVFAQQEDERRLTNAASSIYVISAKAGGVNFVTGKVAVDRKDGKSGYLIKGDELEVGDKVSTGADGKAEILLNPGSYVRLGQNTEFEFVTTSLENLQVKINKGSAIFEVIADNEFNVSVAARQANFNIIKSGVYRVDVAGGGDASIEVWKGRANVEDDQSTELKGGQMASVSGGQTVITKFDRDDKDELEAWSKLRAKDLAKINSKLNRTSLRNSLIAGSRSWNIYDSFGLWVFDSYSRSYCFLPFGYGWRSPYGYWFDRDIWAMNLPWIYYQPPVRNNPSPTTSRNDSTISRTPRNRASSDSNTEQRMPRDNSMPPYTRVQRDIGSDRSRGVDIDNTSPRMVPSMPAPVIVVVPSNTDAKPGRGN
jgi:hypothetical protein